VFADLDRRAARYTSADREENVKRSTDRILVTHVGSLVRPMSIRGVLSARDYGQPYDEAAYERTLQREVAAIVRKQADVGIDIVSDGEFGKAGWIRYVAERLGGFVHREIRPGDHEHNPIYLIREAEKFPEFYAAYTPIQYYDWLPPGESQTALACQAWVAPLSWAFQQPLPLSLLAVRQSRPRLAARCARPWLGQ
jgi:cobalamin-independent methionine synthase catalytic subunit